VTTTARLARLYDTLTPWERLPLLAAAAARGDAVEFSRLARSAPTDVFRVPDCRALVQGLVYMAHSYLLQQLDRAALFWKMTSFMDQEPPGARKRGERRLDDELARGARVLACAFVVSADGWQLFCQRLGIDPEAPLRGLPGYEAVRQMDGLARATSCTEDEMRCWLGETLGRDDGGAGGAPAAQSGEQLETAEMVARGMLAFLEGELAIWS
jgi:hypothetical protein